MIGKFEAKDKQQCLDVEVVPEGLYLSVYDNNGEEPGPGSQKDILIPADEIPNLIRFLIRELPGNYDQSDLSGNVFSIKTN